MGSWRHTWVTGCGELRAHTSTWSWKLRPHMVTGCGELVPSADAGMWYWDLIYMDTMSDCGEANSPLTVILHRVHLTFHSNTASSKKIRIPTKRLMAIIQPTTYPRGSWLCSASKTTWNMESWVSDMIKNIKPTSKLKVNCCEERSGYLTLGRQTPPNNTEIKISKTELKMWGCEKPKRLHANVSQSQPQHQLAVI